MLIPFLPPTRVMTALAEAPGHLLSLFVIRYQNGPGGREWVLHWSRRRL
jgi:hypothetical protein